ncbi:IQ domain-containing protein IQM6 [Prunus yedoensis var. nudiflora]|uniref:IQ domain-containing protein IQM6 n=1 Tax=Prunus yedoensis var. nudiflora TaxID=2094558 RepID=A0A314UW10_PRUYE|nr:IQ domain-containing protein IQM6 [Prunus yedoensis var. nudiflora]
MGFPVSCPLSDFDDLDSHCGAVLVSPVSLRKEEERKPLRSLSSNSPDSEPTTTNGSGKMNIERSLSFKGKESNTKPLTKTCSADMENNASTRAESDAGDPLQTSENQSQEPGKHRYQAALKLQKVYKSFRTRRQLADCAILVEQRWWKALDFAELKRSSISFFDIQKPETAVSRWSRARTRAAKIDPRHRYGHNLHFYYAKWLHCESTQPFFYWLDIGDGREVNHEVCPRSKLQAQCIKYLGPIEREAYEVVMQDGKFIYKQSGNLLDTTEAGDAKWIFVLSTSKTLYIGQKSKGTFQHSSFLAGGATLSAGRLVVEQGILKSVWPHSGHYLPTEENFQEFMLFLIDHNVDLTNVKRTPADDEEGGLSKKSSNIGIRNSPNTGTTNAEGSGQDSTDPSNEDSNSVENANPILSRLPERFCSKIAKLEIPQRNDAFDILKEGIPITCREYFPDSASDDGYETAEESLLTEEDFMIPKLNLFEEDEFEEDEKPVPKEKIMQRIDSHKGMKSYQLAQQLTSRWTTGAGPRIGCMRDYPSELQFRVLEQANLSPRRIGRSPRPLLPSPLCTERTAGKSPLGLQKSKRHNTIG